MRLLSYVAIAAAVACSSAPDDAASSASALDVVPRLLHVEGRRFVDASGRTVILRGANVAGNSKVPPFVPYDDPKSLDALPGLGMNVIRMPFVWEAYEPVRGGYDDRYLGAMQNVARAAWQRGMYVVVDFHQDGFSRFSIGGCGSGFPAWTIPPAVVPQAPDNGERCSDWGTRMFTDPSMHESFGAFHRNEGGVRDAFLDMVQRVSRAFSRIEGVIGYDLLNEPWGWDSELSALYRDEGRRIRQEDPSAILFVEGHITTNAGLPSTLEKPPFEGVAYAPHYYDPVTMLNRSYDGNPAGIDGAFATMEAKAKEWNVPLFVGEIGMFASAEHVSAYVAREYEDLDRVLASGTQWNVSPRWNAMTKDGWNGEDLAILEPVTGALRPNYRPRPFLRATAGIPTSFAYQEVAGAHEVVARWSATTGMTEIFLPPAFFRSIDVSARGAACTRNGDALRCETEQPGDAFVRVLGRP